MTIFYRLHSIENYNKILVMEFPCQPHCALIPKPSVCSDLTHSMLQFSTNPAWPCQGKRCDCRLHLIGAKDAYIVRASEPLLHTCSPLASVLLFFFGHRPQEWKKEKHTERRKVTSSLRLRGSSAATWEQTLTLTEW